MKLSTIVTNNGEPLQGASSEMHCVDKTQHLIDSAVKESTDVLFYGTEFSESDLTRLDKSLSGWKSHIIEKKPNDYRVAYGNNQNVVFDDKRFASRVREKSTIEGVVAFLNDKENSYAGTLQHLDPYAGGKKNLYGVLTNGNNYRKEQIKEGITASRAMWSHIKNNGDPILPKKEFHTGYFDMYGSIVWNLLLRAGKTGQIPQEKFIAFLREAELYQAGSPSHFSYETTKFKIPIRFKGVHTFVSKSLKDSTHVKIISPEGNNDRATIVSKMEW